MPQASTMREVAVSAGVSIVTVSRVVNRSGYVSGATRLRVERAIADLGFAPNPYAQGLARASLPSGVPVTSAASEPRSPMATMTDVAKLAGVSLSTVSYALSGSRPISDATRERILAAMRELDFTPNAMARGLAGRRTRILGLLLPADETRADPFTAEIIVGAAEGARETDHHLLLWTEPAAESTSIRELLRQGLVDGVIVLSVRMDDERVEVLRAGDVPLAMIGCTDSPGDVPYVDTDAAQTTDEAVRHLAELGHRSIAYVAPHQAEPDGGYGIGVRLHDGMLAAGKRHGVDVRPNFVDWSSEAAARGAASLLKRRPGTTGIVVLHDQVLAGVLAGVAASGRSVPGDVSVVGMLITEQIATLLSPRVTTVSPNPAELGRRGAGALIEQLDTPDAPARQELVASTVVQRSTTAVARAVARPAG